MPNSKQTPLAPGASPRRHDSGPGTPVLRQIARGLAGTCETLAAIILIAVTAINLTQVVERYFFNTSIAWAEEIMRYTMMWLMMFGSVACIYRCEHMAVDTIRAWAPERWRQLVRHGLFAIAGIFCFLLVWYGWPAALKNGRQMAAASGIPMSLPYFAIPIGGFLMIVQIVLCWFAGYEAAEVADDGAAS